MTLAFTSQPEQFRAHNGEVFCGSIRLDDERADALLSLFKVERDDAFAAFDEAAWKRAGLLFGALWVAIADAEEWRRAEWRPTEPMSPFGAQIFSMFGAGR
jgi:hypothetical protein